MDDAPPAQRLAAELERARLSIAALQAQLDDGAVGRLTDSLLDGFVLFDPAATILDVNPAFCKITGFSAHELIGTSPPHPCGPPEEMHLFLAALAEVQAGRARPWELHMRHKDDSRIPVLVTPSVLHGEDGEVASVTVMVKDLSEAAAFRARLTESEELFRLVFDQAPVGAVLADLDFHFTRVNNAFCRMLGYTEDELLDLSFPDVTHPDDVDTDVHEIRRLAAGEIALHEREKRYLRKDGGVVWGRIVVRPVVDMAGARIAQLAMIHDVTERRQAEERLRASEEQLRTVLDAALEGIILQSADGSVLTFNPAAGDLLGVEASEVLGESALGRDWHTIHEDGSPWPPEDHPTMRALSTGRPARDLTLGIVRDGRKRWIRANAIPILRDGVAEPVAAVVSFADITDEREFELAIQKAEERSRLLLQNAGDAIILHELAPDGTAGILDVNDMACSLLGYSREELLVLHMADIQTQAQQRRVPAIAETLAERGRAEFEAELLTKDGRAIPVEVSIVRFELQGESVVLSSFRDVTERIAADRALRESETRYRIVADNTYDWEWWIGPDGAFVYCSPGCAEIVGYGAEEFMRDSGRLLEIVHPDDRERVRAHLTTDAVEEPDATALEFRVITSEGIERVLDHRCRPVFADDGTWLGRRANNRDVTERRRAEEEVRRLNHELHQRVANRTEQLDAASRELEALAYSIAHDVRAPLRTIDGFSAAVLEDERRLSDEGVASLQRVRAAAQTLARRLDDLSGLSRVSRRELVRKTIDLSALAQEIGEELAAENPSRVVSLSVAPRLPAHADPVLARVLLRELLGNAWKFTAPRPEAHVEVGTLDMKGERAFFVRDDGAGFEMRYAEHLFGAFQRMHSPGEFEGDGIGLALVQRLVRRHGGRCWAEAEVDHGATFFFTLPDEADAPADS